MIVEEKEDNQQLEIKKEFDIQIKKEETQIKDLMEDAKHWVKSGLLPSSIKTPEQAIVIVLKGRELGLPIMASFEMIDVIQGKPALKPKAMSAIIRKAGVRFKTMQDFESVKNEEGKVTDKITTIRFYRDGIEEDISYRYTDAQSLGLTTKDNWQKQPAVMTYWRCFSKGANRICPDLIGGLYTTEEVSSFTKGNHSVSITEDGDSIVIE